MGGWDAETAEWYAEKYGEYATNRLAVDEVTIPADAIVVDVGCGTGAALRHAARYVTVGRLVGVDPVPRMIEIAREKTAGHPGADRIEYRVGAAESLPVEDDSADLVLAFDSMDHWDDRGRGLAEVKRVLRPGGRLLVVKDAGVPDSKAARETLADELRQAGLDVIEHRDVHSEGVRFGLWVCVNGAADCKPSCRCPGRGLNSPGHSFRSSRRHTRTPRE